MTPQLIIGIVGASVCAVGVAADVFTTNLAFHKGSTEANPLLIKLHITTPLRLDLLGAVVILAGTLVSRFVPFIGAGIAVGMGVAGIVQTIKTIKIL